MALDQRVTRIIQNVQLHCVGVTDTPLQIEYYNALDEFFKDSNVWQEQITFPVVALTTGPVDYTINAANNGIINRLMWVKNSNGDVLSDFTLKTPGTAAVIEQRNAPSTADTYTANVAQTCIDPTDQVTNVGYPFAPSWFYDKYGNVLLDGIVGKLMMMPGKPWSNQQLGIYHTRRFRNGVSLAYSESRRSNIFGGQFWSFTREFGVRRRKM